MRRRQLEHLRTAVRARTAIAVPQAEPAELDRLRDRLVRDDPALAQGGRRLRTMPGRGKVPAATLPAEPPEPAGPGRRGIASLAGPAPAARDGGLRQNRRVIEGGRSLARQVLHLGAAAGPNAEDRTCASRHAAPVGRGKARKVAPAALMRTMIVTPDAMPKARTARTKAVAR